MIQWLLTWILGSFLVTPFALTSWHVVVNNQGVAVHRGWLVELMCNRKEIMWYENNAVRFRVKSESRVKPGKPSRSEVLGHLWWYSLQGGASVGTPWLLPEIMSPSLSICLSIYLSNLQQTVCPLSRIKWEIYFYKEECFVLFIEVCSLSFIMFLVGSMRSIQHKAQLTWAVEYTDCISAEG